LINPQHLLQDAPPDLSERANRKKAMLEGSRALRVSAKRAAGIRVACFLGIGQSSAKGDPLKISKSGLATVI